MAQEAPPQAHKDSVNPLAEKVTNAEVRVAFKVLYQENREDMTFVNPNVGTMACKARYFTRIIL